MTTAAPAGSHQREPRPADGVVAPDGYRPTPGRLDECVRPDGSVNTRWRAVAAELGALGPDGLLARRDELVRVLRAEGATYNVIDDDGWERSPWQLDPCPLVLDDAEWQELEAGLAQRAALLDLVVADLLGPRRLLAEGWIPAEPVLTDPAFLRPCVGAVAPGPARPLFSAVDLVRDSSGEFRPLDDRVQAPSGLGYALVNRSALSKVFPALYRESGVERLAGFLRAIRRALAAAAPGHADEPRIVILTPGARSETTFEHAYLASYLGYPLAEGRDLVVERGRLWLRSLAGLEGVDVVIRRVDDAYCDPVELRADSLLGVPGLLEVVRAGRVRVVNPLGSGIAENPVIGGLLDSLSPQLLGEEPQLRGPETWWCGEAHACSTCSPCSKTCGSSPSGRGRGRSRSSERRSPRANPTSSGVASTIGPPSGSPGRSSSRRPYRPCRPRGASSHDRSCSAPS